VDVFATECTYVGMYTQTCLVVLLCLHALSAHFFVCISTYVHIRTCVYVTHKRMYIICVRSGSVRMCQVW
jgi:hypothetical protein